MGLYFFFTPFRDWNKDKCSECSGSRDLTDENRGLHGSNEGKKPSRLAEYKEVNFLTAERWLVKELFHLTNVGYLISQPFIIIKPCFIAVSFFDDIFMTAASKKSKKRKMSARTMPGRWMSRIFEFCCVTYSKES